jgi:hypothetical protein
MDDNQQSEEELTPQESMKLITKMLEKVQDDALWKVAKKRSAFKVSFAAYVLTNGFLIGVWYFTTGPHNYFWPAWPMVGWGFGIGFQYVDAYLGSGAFSEEREYGKLKKKMRDEEAKK